MTLLSCDVKVATRLPKYIHARAGIGAEGARRAGPHRLGFSSAVGLLDQMNRSVLLHQQGQAGGIRSGGGHVIMWDLRLPRWKSTFMKADND